jgi:hypothetical protein
MHLTKRATVPCRAEGFIGECREAFAEGKAPPDPTTAGELLAALDSFPGRGWRFLPAEREREFLGFCVSREPSAKPFGRKFKSRLLATVKSDKEFARALVAAFREAAR